MYLIFKVQTPKKQSREQKKLFEEINKYAFDEKEIRDFNKFTEKNDK